MIYKAIESGIITKYRVISQWVIIAEDSFGGDNHMQYDQLKSTVWHSIQVFFKSLLGIHPLSKRREEEAFIEKITRVSLFGL